MPKKPDPNIDRTMIYMDNWGGPWPEDTWFANNIFWVQDETKYVWGGSKNHRFENNLFYGTHAAGPEDARAVRADPMFAGPVRWGAGLDSLAGFTLRPGSPAVRAGLPVAERVAPRLVSVTLEPLDGASWVERGAAPRTLPLGGLPTLTSKVWVRPAGRSEAPFGGTVATVLPGLDASPAARQVLGFALVFIGVLVAGAAVAYLLSRLIRAAGLGFVDRFLGALFGLARGAALVVLFVLVAGLTALPRYEWWQNASLAPALVAAALALRPWLPAAWAGRLDYSRAGPRTARPGAAAAAALTGEPERCAES